MYSIDLFSGCGGMSLGFKMAGVHSILASDIDENCEKTFTYNFPKTPFIRKDSPENAAIRGILLIPLLPWGFRFAAMRLALSLPPTACLRTIKEKQRSSELDAVFLLGSR